VGLYEWDPAKEQSNVRKHGITFDVARRVFDDPDAILDRDRFEGGEYRWQTIGLVNGVIMLTVAHTVRDGAEAETIRIISARRASRPERRRYEAKIDTSQW
jgi:uncharacterized DUF497 family protein